MPSRLAKLNEAYVQLHRVRLNLIPKPEEIDNVRMLSIVQDLIEDVFREEIEKEKEEWTEKYRLQKRQSEEQQQHQQQQQQQQQQYEQQDKGFVDCRIDTKEFSFSFRRSRPYRIGKPAARRGRNLRQ